MYLEGVPIANAVQAQKTTMPRLMSHTADRSAPCGEQDSCKHASIAPLDASRVMVRSGWSCTMQYNTLSSLCFIGIDQMVAITPPQVGHSSLTIKHPENKPHRRKRKRGSIPQACLSRYKYPDVGRGIVICMCSSFSVSRLLSRSPTYAPLPLALTHTQFL